MAWIEFHTQLRDHWKINRLSMELEIDYITALGAVSCLWLWCVDYARDGNIGEFSDPELMHAARINNSKWSLQLLKKCQLVTDKGKINDWHKHGLKYLESSRLRMKRVRERLRNGVRTVRSTQPNLTLPNHTVPNPTQPTEEKTKTSRGYAAPRSAKLAKKISDTTPHWQPMIKHMATTWEFKKNKGNPDLKYQAKFVFDVKWSSKLKALAGLYQAFGVMALWDEYLKLDDAWSKTSGYSFEMFLTKIPSLTDGAHWRNGARKHEETILGPVAPETIDLLSGMTKKLEGAK